MTIDLRGLGDVSECNFYNDAEKGALYNQKRLRH
jgi:hypothetical protein